VAEYADLAETGSWQGHFERAEAVVMLQAQIGGEEPALFIRNNQTSTGNVLAAMKLHGVPYMVHVSSSVVMSKADDDYTRTKRAQEDLVKESAIDYVILRPTLMFGWFDRKHLGWLSRFMQKVPVFPVPGDGRFIRQPLYARDFCNIIVSCLKNPIKGEAFNISGREQITYINIINEIKRAMKSPVQIVKIPAGIFRLLLAAWAMFDNDPPFTVSQLDALMAGDKFEIIDWPHIFGVAATPFTKAVDETFNHPKFSKIALEF
jgi:nucleoside-diphosphate-sugar epimerase